MVGSSDGEKIIGPGHASFVQDATNPDVYYAVYAASVGENCNRKAFIEEMQFNPVTGWPYINFPDPGPDDVASGSTNRTNVTIVGAVNTRSNPPRRVAPCSALNSEVVSSHRWKIPSATACKAQNKTGAQCFGAALDNTGAICTVNF